MPDARLDVYLLGEPRLGVTRLDLVRNLATAFKKDIPVIEKMLSCTRCLIKKDVDEELAKKYQATIEKAGGICELEPHVDEALEVDAPEAASTPYAAPVSHNPRLQQGAQHFCYKCGSPIANTAAPNCPKCFAPQLHLTAKNKTLAGVLAFFIGGLGVHRFYLGQWWGLFYLIFWFTLIPSVVSVIEAIVFWTTSSARWQKKYGQVPKAGGGMAAVFIASLFVFIMVLGIVSAVALPAYQDYTIRAKVASAELLVDEVRSKVAAYVERTNEFPRDNSDIDLDRIFTNEAVNKITVLPGGRIEVTFVLPTVNHSGNTMIWTPNLEAGKLTWSCKGGTLADRYRATACRGGVNAASVSSGDRATQLTKRVFNDDGRLSLNVPAHWHERKGLSDDAVLGVADLIGEGYVIVLEEAREDFEEDFTLTDYSRIVLSNMKESIKDPQTPGKIRRFKINGLPAEQVVLIGSVDHLMITYVVTTVETDKGFYQVLSWTLSSRFKTKHKLLRDITKSFVVRSYPD